MNTAAEAKNNLAKAAASFGSGSNWGELLVAFRAYDQELQKQIVQAPIDLLPVFQGRAQGSATILGIFENCQQIAGSIIQQKANPK